jgi:GTP pyrophosphokinase
MLPISQRFQDALAVAVTLHADHARKGSGVPYIAHLLSVSALAMEHGADEDEAIAALLHDAVEDRGGKPTLTEIRNRFGERVAAIVEGCTDADTEPKPPWRPRKEAYIRHLREEADASVRLVSAADKLHNARSILSELLAEGDVVFDRFKGGKQGTLWYYRELAEALKETGPARLATELDHAVTELERLSASQ